MQLLRHDEGLVKEGVLDFIPVGIRGIYLPHPLNPPLLLKGEGERY